MPRSDVPDRIRAVREYATAPSIVLVRRPILVHEHAEEDNKVVCICCNSTKARIKRRIEFLDVLIELDSGDRSVLQKLTDPEEIEEWHAIAGLESTLVLDNPVRCAEEALPAILDWDSLVLFFIAGSQGGKTSVAAEILWNRILVKGGAGAMFLWVAPRQKDTQIAVKKLHLGVRGDRWIAPIIPPELVVSSPKTHLVADQEIRIREGSVVDLRYASRDGDNIKGVVALDGVFDEATAVEHEINYSILLARMSTTGGGLVVPSTPKDPAHWLRPLSEAAPTYDEAAVMDEPAANRRVTLSRVDNPWCSPRDTARHIEASGGPTSPRVQREIFGKWTGDGERKWTHYSPTKHLVPWVHRDVGHYGYVDLTAIVARELFRGRTKAKNVVEIGGFDFNYWPYSCAVAKIICRKEDDHRNPKNWILYFVDCVVKRAKSTPEFATFLRREAGAWNGRGLRKGHYAGLHGIADATGFYKNTRDRSATATADAKELTAAGFVVRPPSYTDKRKERNPPNKVRDAWLNELLRTDRILVNEITCIELAESLGTEVAGKKAANTKADRLSGITDAGGYVAYSALFHRTDKPADDRPGITAAGWR